MDYKKVIHGKWIGNYREPQRSILKGDEYPNEMLILFNNGKKCPIVECSKELKPTPKGTIPGLW